MLEGVSQLFLRPIHDDLMNCLSKLPCDRTYTQDPYHTWNKIHDDQKFWSMDLSSATDRFPLSLQEKLLGVIYTDSKFAWSWGKLLIGRRFWVPTYDPNFGVDDGADDEKTKTVMYTVGQPMGAYSSWAAFSLSHHLVVHYCAKLCGYDNFEFDQYIILGDDIVVYDNDVATKYKTVISNLGVELSPTKTHVSKDTYEFAKRWIKLGKEITPFPILGLVENIHNPFLVYSILFNYSRVKNCWFPIHEDLTSFVVNLCRRANRAIYLNLILPKVKSKFYGPHFSPSQWLVIKKHLLPRDCYFSRLKMFSFSLRNTFGMSTYDELRTHLCYIKNDNFVIPNFRIGQEVYSWVLKRGSERLVNSSNQKLVSLSSQIKKLINSFGVDNVNDLGNVPVFHAILNNLNEKVILLSDFDQDKISIKQFAQRLVQLDVDKIVVNDRNPIENLLTIGQTFIDGCRVIEGIEDDLYYGSLGISNLESTLSATMGPNLRFAINQLVLFKEGTYVDPMANPWAAYM